MIRKIIIAPDSFKGTLSAIQVCAIIESAAKRHIPQIECISLPVADGGEGLVDSLLYACGGERVTVETVDPLMRPVQASYGILPDQTAVIEMAAAAGLPLLKPAERNPLNATSYGAGLLIGDALAKDCRKIILGLGGSATNDGGIGAASALGFRFLDEAGEAVAPNGRGLADIRSVDIRQVMPELRQTQIRIACDVINPLCGPNGAAAVFGPQKGATPDMVVRLDDGLFNLANILARDHDFSVKDLPGTGAAGGMAVPFLLLGQTTLQSGLDLVLDAMRFDSQLAGCDLVITGEGKTDRQSAMGKVLSGIAKRSRAAGVPVVAISGAVDKDCEALYALGITAIFDTCRRVASLEETLASAAENLDAVARDLFRLIAAMNR